jgi:NADH dehydrogenase ubiquinone Fe-S protein 4
MSLEGRCRIARPPPWPYTGAIHRPRRIPMSARIYKPSKTAMQSGLANTKAWVLDYEPEQPRQVEPLMGWTSSGDMRQQVRLRFASKEEAVAYCEREGIPYQVFEAKPSTRRVISYSDNFAFKRRDAWTH